MKPSQRLEDAVKRTGRTRELGPIELYERTVLAAGRRVEQLSKRSRELARELKRTRATLRAARREFRVLLQHKPDVTLEQLELAGKSDATDRAIELSNQRALDSLRAVKQAAAAAFGCSEVHDPQDGICGKCGGNHEN